MVSRVMEKSGAAVQEWSMMYKTVVQMVLMYGSKSWLVKVEVLMVIEVSHHCLSRRIVGKTARRAVDSRW